MSFVYDGVTYPSPGDKPSGSGPLTAGLTAFNDPANWVQTGSNDSGATSTFTPPADSQFGQLLSTGKVKLPDVPMMTSDSQGNSSWNPEYINAYWGQLPNATIGGRQWGPTDLTWLGNDDKRQLLYPGLVSDDPNYGRITPTGNFAPSGDWLDTVGGYIPAIIAAIAGGVTLDPALLGAAFSGGLGTTGSLLFKDITNTLFQKGG